MKDKILVFGADGLVGSRFTDLYHTETPFVTPKIDELDITNKKAVELFFETHKDEFHSIVNFAAFTDVSGAEKERGDESRDCYRVNVTGPQFLAEVAKKFDKFFLQISTDYVFPGSKENPGPYSEDSQLEATPNNLTWYGWTKLLGEKKIREILPSAAILRIQLPFRAHYKLKLDLARNILTLYDEGRLYPMFDDQQITPSFIDDVAKVMYLLVEEKKSGVFHATCREVTTPFEFASYLLERARGVKNAVKPVSLDKFWAKGNDPVRYPKYGGLKTDKTQEELGVTFMTWREAIDELVKQLG